MTGGAGVYSTSSSEKAIFMLKVAPAMRKAK
jgi:hypothetical protein